jgi:copper homeostasis protein
VSNSEPVLEVIACSVADAIEAEKGGAMRLEVIRDFAHGGMAPPVELVRDILDAVSVPLRVMVRESESYGVVDDKEIERLCSLVREFALLEIDGLVLGFLRDEQVDSELVQRVLSCAPGLKATFHHAFEETRDSSEAIETLKSIGQVDRILTAGGQGDWSQKTERLGSYQQMGKPEITILAGGGLNLRRIQSIRATTRINEFHVGRAVRFESRIDRPVQAELVDELVRAIEEGETAMS